MVDALSETHRHTQGTSTPSEYPNGGGCKALQFVFKSMSRSLTGEYRKGVAQCYGSRLGPGEDTDNEDTTLCTCVLMDPLWRSDC